MTQVTLTREDKNSFYRQLLFIGFPIILQQLVGVCLNLVDTIMVGKVSEEALAAVGAANQIYFIYTVLLFGIFSGAGVYLIQFWGIRDLTSLRKILGIDYMMFVIVAIPVVMLSFFAAPFLIGLFSSDALVIELGTDYMRIACWSFFFSGLTFLVSYNSRATAMLKVPTIVNLVAICINIFLNYCLIFGNFGMPKMGVEGAAMATLIARVLECIGMYSYVYLSKNNPLRAMPKELFGFSKEMFRNVMKTAVPVILNESLWAVSVAMIFAAYGRIGATALAVVQIANTATDVFHTVYTGLSNASAVIIGQTLGQGKRDNAYGYSGIVLKVTWILNVIMTVLFIISRGPIADIYDFNAETTSLLMDSLFVYAIAITPKMLAYLIICGILRAGGDTLYCMIIDASLNMIFQVPLAFIAVLVLDLSLPLVIAVVAISDFVKVIFCYQRYFSKKWVNVFTGM